MSVSYVITLCNERPRYINIFGLLLSAGSIVFFLSELITLPSFSFIYFSGIVVIAGLVVRSVILYKNKKTPLSFTQPLMMAGIVWTQMPYFSWLLFVFVALALLEFQAKYPLQVQFSEQQVIFNQLVKKKYTWNDIDNVTLKDGLLTIDYKNNRLFQQESDSEDTAAFEKQFNSWCQDRLNTTANQRSGGI